MRRFELARRISHADVDHVGELKVSALLGMLEQAAVEASTDAGYDAARYTTENGVWIIRRTRLARHVPVGGGDEVGIATWVADFRRARSLRQYEVRHLGTLVAEAVTDWVYCDMRTGRPIRVPRSLEQALSGDEKLPALPRDEDLPAAATGEPVEMEIEVQPSHLDHLVHVNNAIYAAFLEDGAFRLFATRGWPLERMRAAGGSLRLDRLDAEYFSDATVADRLLVRSWLADEIETARLDSAPTPPPLSLVQVISRPGGSEILRARTDWGWRWTPKVLGGVPGRT